MLSLAISIVVYFVASYFIKREFDAMGLPKGLTRGLMVFCLSAAAAYGAAAAVDWVAGHV